MNNPDKRLLEYVENNILPRYDSFDRAHRRDHVMMVIEQSMKLAENLPMLDINMVYCIAAFHDLGLVNGREEHHIFSGRILEEDQFVISYFAPEQIKIMKEAVEDHRASGKTKPRSEYGLVVADADRFIDADTIIRRTVQYGLSNYPELDRDKQLNRAVDHLNKKYGRGGYLKVWLTWGDNAARLNMLQDIIDDEIELISRINVIYDDEIKIFER